MAKPSDLIVPLWTRQSPCYIMLDCLMASGSMQYALWYTYTIDLLLDHSNGKPCMKSGVLDTFWMSHTSESSAAKYMYIYLQIRGKTRSKGH
jgi:hypothetical protein